MNPTTSVRVIIDKPLDGPANMARDEALMLGVGRGESPPTIRFYQWNPPTISLGYFQRYADYEKLPSPAGELAVVRRLTGGGAILHDQELTYSMALPVGHPLLSGGPNRLYEIAHDAVIETAKGMGVDASRGCESDDSGAAKGPFFCFARRHCLDVLIGQGKFAGSAQRRTRSAVLQHGSIVLARRFDQQPAAAIDSLSDGHAIEEWIDGILASLVQNTKLQFKRDEWRDDEMCQAHDLIEKYAGDEWTRRT